MGIYSCFFYSWRKKKLKGESNCYTHQDKDKVKTYSVKLEHLEKSSDIAGLRTSILNVSVPFHVPENSVCNIMVTNNDSPLAIDSRNVCYEGEDEMEGSLQMRRNDYDYNLLGEDDDSDVKMHNYFSFRKHVIDTQSDNEKGLEMIESGHVSDPGMEKAHFWASPKLKRSCSDLAMRDTCKEIVEQQHLGKSKSYEDIQLLAAKYKEVFCGGDAVSSVTVVTHRSADKVILKKHSSSRILPSRSKRLWWQLFMWSHRNLYREVIAKTQPVSINMAINLQGGYSSDTIEPRRGKELNKLENLSSWRGRFTDEADCNINVQKWDEMHGVSGMWPQNQWVACPSQSSPFARVDEWVNEISVHPPLPVENCDNMEYIFFPPSPDNGTLMASHSNQYDSIIVPEEISHANAVVQSLNASSSVAHMTGIQLKVIPSISHLSSLRSVNLSGNLIAHITTGSLPKGLHALNLSRNKINVIEGLRELTRLRVIDLSYNRISQIGQGLSNCTLAKELYLAGNKISNVEGLHRLLKLTVLDLSFNKISTTKALGQVVANYNSLLALNLLGNPIQRNISDDQLRKKVCSLLPMLALLNKQPLNSQKAREISTDAIAKAGLGNRIHHKQRKVMKRGSLSTSSTSFHINNANDAHTSRHGSKSHFSRRLLLKETKGNA